MHNQTLALMTSLTHFSDSMRNTALKTLLCSLQGLRSSRRVNGTLHHYLDDIPPPLRQRCTSASHAIPQTMRTETAHINVKLSSMLFDYIIDLKLTALIFIPADLDISMNDPLTVVCMNYPHTVMSIS